MFSFAKTQRLLTKSQYDYVFAQAKKLVVADFILLYRENMLDHARLGLAISKRMVAKAHDRNRIKRLIRESFRLQETLPTADVIVLVKSGIAKIPEAALKAKLSQAWNRLAVTYVK